MKIENTLPDSFAVVFDGWSAGPTHYVSVFATFPAELPAGYDKLLLGIAPMGEELSQSAEEHVDFLDFVLEVFGRSRNNVAALIGDNANTNRAFARKFGAVFIGCHSHKFNLAMKDMLLEHDNVIEKVNVLMGKLSYSIPAALLRQKTSLCAKRCNTTRWSSTFEMMQRYCNIRHHLPEIDHPEVQELLLSEEENSDTDALLKRLTDLNSVTVELQSDCTTLEDCRVLFDGVLEKYPLMKDRLGDKTSMVLNPHFEEAIRKIQRGEESELKGVQQRATLHLRKKRDVGVTPKKVSTPMSFAKLLLKKSKNRTDGSESKYVDTRFIVPTSNLCERLFSKAGYVLSDRRRGLLPSNFEMQLFLHFNSRLWSIEDVHDILQ